MDRNTSDWQANKPDFSPTWFRSEPLPPSAPATAAKLPTERLWFGLMGARVAIAILLLLMQVFVWVTTHQGFNALALCAVYLVATLGVLRWSRPSQSQSLWSAKWAMTLWLDVGVFGALQFIQGAGFDYTALLAIPVLVGSVLGPFLLALGSASAASLLLLITAGFESIAHPHQATSAYLQAALTGSGLFLISLLAHQMSVRLAREQDASRQSQWRAQAEAQINQLVVNGMNEGVLVVDHAGQIWHANAAVFAMLGIHEHQDAQRLTELSAWPILQSWIQTSTLRGHNPEADLTLRDRWGAELKVRVRANLTESRPDTNAPPVCVLLLEDLRDVEAKVRTEKLAAMGRVSAALAHEIRNPLTAIAQANALLEEDIQEPTTQRLTTIIGHNARRLRQTVDDILDTVTPHPFLDPRAAPMLPLDETIKRLLDEWLSMRQPNQRRISQDRLIWRGRGSDVQIRFDPDHLRRILVNLLENADKYAPPEAQAVIISTDVESTHGSSRAALLRIWNAGEPLPARVQQHLFEPFVSSQSRSSGLGLYICQELCERHGASLQYSRETEGMLEGNAFTLRFPIDNATSNAAAHS